MTDLPGLSPITDPRTINEAVNVLIRDYNSGRVETLEELEELLEDTRLLQSVSFQTGAHAIGSTQIPVDDTIPQQTEGDQYMSLAITPKSATSKLVIDVVLMCGTSAAVTVTAALFRDSVANAVGALPQFFSAASTGSIKFRRIVDSGTTSATTFKVRAGPGGAANVNFNGLAAARLFGGVMASSITIREELP